MANRNIIAGLDIGTTWVRLIVCDLKPGDPAPQVLTMVKKPARGLRRGYVINPEEVTAVVRETIAEAERNAKVPVRRVVLGLSGVSVDSRLAEGAMSTASARAEISLTDINRAIEASERNLPEMANRQVITRQAITYKIDGKKVLGRPEGLSGSKFEVKTIFVTCLQQHLEDLVSAVEAAGVTVEDIVPSPLATGLAVTTKAQKMAGCVVVNIGAQTTAIAVFEEELPISVQIFPLGSLDITNDIALGFRIPLEEAERVKRGEGEPIGTKKKLDEIIEARLSDIFEFIERHLKRLGVAGLLPAGMMITGGGASINEIEDLAKNYFKLPARLAVTTLAANSKSQIRDITWATAYGLCLHRLEENDLKPSGLELLKTAKAKLVGWLREFIP
ncbi:MAG: cell division protein FtsA [Candidatus Vogelbacteria bacterium CG10_big_fil_rev_8_21_14_0_10_49_38]|uniref:Cell division protein FtsA n=1 Tax=Candidatus Vogelbacteria bacterium CG10_big_fil_rev_8_21_14_0_10_49_38 TaxID=1975043 RepID=A0A2H0RI97_9BACT|nr:MAG: cell division protein FtsA [bacterium CG10_49_38]PIR45754.1 MAG: cell division protein FtsA [Candidatus Vogelbacteria bacterium CG10_big_fil_rev_8_21_14_0_10_49_38]